MNRIFAAYSEDIFIITDNFLEVCFPLDEGYLEILKGNKSDKKPEELGNRLGNRLGNQLGNRLGETKEKILSEMRLNPDVSGNQLAEILGISTTAVEKNIKQLREEGIINRIGGTRGHWEVING